MGWTVQGGALRRVGCLGRDPNWAVGHPDFFPSLVASVLSFSMWSLQGWGLDPYMVARGSPEGAFLGEEAEAASHAWKWHRGSSTTLLVNAAGWGSWGGVCTRVRPEPGAWSWGSYLETCHCTPLVTHGHKKRARHKFPGTLSLRAVLRRSQGKPLSTKCLKILFR